MISDLDIWRAANLLIRRHGANPEAEAARLHHLMLDRGDDEGRVLWVRIRHAIEVMRAPPSGKPNCRGTNDGLTLIVGIRETAFKTGTGRSTLAAGTALHAP